MAEKSSVTSETGEASAADTPETREQIASKLVDRFALWSGVAGLVPVPILDAVAVGGLQIQMVRRISQIYDVDFTENRGKALIASIAGSMIPADERHRRRKRAQGGSDHRNDRGRICYARPVSRRHLCHRQGVHSALCHRRHASRFQSSGLPAIHQGPKGHVGFAKEPRCQVSLQKRERQRVRSHVRTGRFGVDASTTAAALFDRRDRAPCSKPSFI